MNFSIINNLKKIHFAKTNDKEAIKKQKAFYCGLYNSDKINEFESYNTYLFNIDKKFFIIDIDGEDALNYFNSLVVKHKINYCITKSISNVNKVNKSKYHIYLKNNLNIETNESIQDLEMLVDKLIFEDVKQFDKNIDLNNLPELKEDFYNDLLKYKLKDSEKSSPGTIENDNKTTDENNKIKDLLDILDDERSNNYDDWFKIGMILKSINKDNIDLYNDFSKRSPNKYKGINDISKYWKGHKIRDDDNKKLTISSLCYYAQQDNQQLYNEWVSKYNKINTDETYETIKFEFEKNNFFIKNPVMYGTINFENELVLRNESDFKILHQRLKYFGQHPKTGELKELYFIKMWLFDNSCRQYEKLEFLPKQETPIIFYNSFSGFEVEKQQENEDDRVNGHLETRNLNFEDSNLYKLLCYLCGNEKNVIEYVIKWIANIIQKPYEITKVALLFKSMQGAGKNLFWDWVGKAIIGQKYFFDTEKIDLVFGRFNGLIENILLGIINETSGKDTFNIIELIKGLITSDINMIEHKGMKPYGNKNYIGLVFLTNNSNSINIPADDRRFVGIKCNSDICNDPVFFPKVVEEIKNKKYDKCFHDYLMAVDIKNFNFTTERPKTSFYNDMVELNRPILTNFMLYLYHSTVQEITGAALFNLYSIYLQKLNIVNKISGTKFGISIKEYNGIIKNKNNKGVMVYTINKLDLREYLIKKCAVDADEFLCETSGFLEEINNKSEVPYRLKGDNKINVFDFNDTE